MLSRVIYTNKQGNKEVRLVPEGTLPMNYFQGVLIGPPDLDKLKLGKAKATLLNNALVEAGLITLKDLNGKRSRLVQIIQETLEVPEQRARELRNSVLSLYQREAYPELFEDKQND